MKHDGDRPYEIVFLTDGEPTIGETNEDLLVSEATKESNSSTRVFCFGIGNDVNTHLLDRIADDTHAFSTYVEPQEDIEVKVSNFYTKIREPVLSNVELAFTGPDIRVSQIYPSSMPDLYKGEMLVAFGRYSGHGAAAVKITGTFDGAPQQFVNDVKFADQDTSTAYVPRLWATRRVGWLLDQIRMHGESAELKDEVTRLAREHGIVTPYTAYLILEDERNRRVPISMQSFRELGADDYAMKNAGGKLNWARAEAADDSRRSGAGAVAAAKDVRDLRANSNLDELAQAPQQEALSKAGTGAHGPLAPFGTPSSPAQSGYRVAQNYSQQAKVINGRAFYQNGTIWTDSTAQSLKNLKSQDVKFGSDEYFAILKDHPEATAWLALANEVDVVIGDTLYQVR
jgi:Ca-activated chloride channel family protein